MRRGQKGRIFALLEREEYDEILKLFDASPDLVRRSLTMATFHPEETAGEAAVRCFGFLARARGRQQPEFFRETIRRHIWAMNDESGNMDWRGPEIIAQIVSAQPALYEEFASIMIEAALAEPVFYPSLKKAVALLAATDPKLIEYQRTRLEALGMLA
ncbi:MAG TPA: hypothetical protein GXX34_07155 [Clostridia bacterium]|nr:hypothetical protein [Clostridia bacterium]